MGRNDEHVQRYLEQLAEIDAIILEASQTEPLDSYHFMSLVHQKEGLQNSLQQDTGKIARWSPKGYQLDEE